MKRLFDLQMFAEGDIVPSLENPELDAKPSDEADEGKKPEAEPEPAKGKINLEGDGKKSEEPGESGEDKKESWDDFKYEPEKIDGQDVIGAAYVERFIEDAKGKLNLGPKTTKALLDYISDVNKTDCEKRNKENEELLSGFEDEIKADKLVGGKNLAKNIKIARKGLEYLTDGDKKDIDTLAQYGFLKLPAVVRLCYRAGIANEEGKIVNGENASPEKNPLKALYPSHYKK